MASTTAAAAANEFLNIAGAEGSPVDQMKLQKLLFYAHAWNLALRGEALFEEDFEAWPWGPVIRDIYFQTRECGRSPIVKRMQQMAKTGSGPLDFTLVVPNGVEDPETKAFLKSIWDSLRGYSGIQLSNATHAAGEPWTIVKEQFGTDSKPTIPNTLIDSVFRQKLNGNAAGNTTAG